VHGGTANVLALTRITGALSRMGHADKSGALLLGMALR
jgi:hypothetical protein